ncbi:hypothetical protein Rhe02_33730 [Rhizocola hellebori]|uniref:Uncharacterized protein n=1 Tax=Rhizocola hellebori TaxID=1392758 RepID=A0A8J3VGS5_9ACTN|nr:hypothetical protein [Rhizocola hellebori]GIH05306.1 hypothetical protein Rhe02_33730 [Rhizocola hellebori]
MAAFAAPRLRQPDLVEQAMADQAIALIETVDTETSNIDTLATTLDTLYRGPFPMPKHRHNVLPYPNLPGAHGWDGARWSY